MRDMLDAAIHRSSRRHRAVIVTLVILPVLPLVPLMICYWKPDEGMPSDLNLFFDDTAEANLAIEAIYTLGAGLALMFEKIAQRHG